MKSPLKLLVFSGSLREASINQQLALAAVKHLEDTDTSIRVIQLNDYALPLFNQDHEARDKSSHDVLGFIQLLADHDAFLISSPEYNGSISAALKNALDWGSRSPENIGNVFAGKQAAIISSSPGRLGGLRGLAHLRQVLTNLGVIVLPKQLAVANARQAFDKDGELADKDQQATLRSLVSQLIDMSKKLS